MHCFQTRFVPFADGETDTDPKKGMVITMKKTTALRILSVSLLILLAVFSLFGCANGASDADTEDSSAPIEDTTDIGGVIGQGEKSFELTIVYLNGDETVVTVRTDKETVGEALEDAQLISGENGAFGLYVKAVNGVVADYDVDGTYWAFYVNGEYAPLGVDQTKIEDGASYSFKIEKA